MGSGKKGKRPAPPDAAQPPAKKGSMKQASIAALLRKPTAASEAAAKPATGSGKKSRKASRGSAASPATAGPAASSPKSPGASVLKKALDRAFDKAAEPMDPNASTPAAAADSGDQSGSVKVSSDDDVVEVRSKQASVAPTEVIEAVAPVIANAEAKRVGALGGQRARAKARKAKAAAASAPADTTSAAASSAPKAGTAKQGKRGRPRSSEWDDPVLREKQWYNVVYQGITVPDKSPAALEGARVPMEDYECIVWDKHKKVLFCDICLKKYERCSDGVTQWGQKEEGNYVMRVQTVKNHLESVSHIAALARPGHDDGVWKRLIVAGNKNVGALLRTAYKIAKANQAIATFELDASLLAACKADGVPVAGAYQSRKTCDIMLRCLSDALDDQLCNALKVSPFVAVTIDESTDITVKKYLSIYVTYMDPKKLKVHSKFLQLQPVDGAADAEGLFGALQQALEECGVSWEKVVAFTSDGASVMTGHKNGVGARVKRANPFAISLVCVAHKLALCLSDLFKEHEVLEEFDKLLQKLHGYFSQSSKRRAELAELQEVLCVDVLNLLKVHTVRWLSRANCCERVRRCYPSLLSYFKQEAEKNSAADEIYNQLLRADTLILTYAMSDMLQLTAELSCQFQSRDLSFVDVKEIIERGINTISRAFTYHTHDGQNNVQPRGTFGFNNLLKNLKDHKGLWPPPPPVPAGSTAVAPKVVRHQLTSNVSWDKFSVKIFQQRLSLDKIAKALIDNITDRFPSGDLDVAAAFNIFSPAALAKADPSDLTFGFEAIELLCTSYSQTHEVDGKVMGPIVDSEDGIREWERWAGRLMEKARVAIAAAEKGAKARKAKAGGVGSRDAVAVLVSARAFYEEVLPQIQFSAPNLAKLIQIMLISQPSSAEVERGFSRMNDIKRHGRSCMRLETLETLMRIALNGPSIALRHQSTTAPPWKAFDEELLPDALWFWHEEESRMPQRSCRKARTRARKAEVCVTDEWDGQPLWEL